MSDAWLFTTIFVGFFLFRIVLATLFFLALLPSGDRCPNCNTPTLRIQSRGWNLLLPWFRTSWCYACNWEGLLRHGPLTPESSSQAVSSTTPLRRPSSLP
jgi:hypothetical protein